MNQQEKQAIKNVLDQLERTYEKSNPHTEGICLSIRALKGLLKNNQADVSTKKGGVKR